MKKILVSFLLLFGALGIFAQSHQTKPISANEQYLAELRNKLNIDYSMPDFSTSKLEANIIGYRLAWMLNRLQDNYKDVTYNQYLSMIVCERNDSLNHVTIESFKIKNISKTGNVITIQSKAKLSKNLLGIKNTDITMVFTEGVSDSKAINMLFSDLSRYLKE